MFGTPFVRLLRRWRSWRRRRRDAAALAALPRRTLEDIGRWRDVAAARARRPFRRYARWEEL